LSLGKKKEAIVPQKKGIKRNLEGASTVVFRAVLRIRDNIQDPGSLFLPIPVPEPRSKNRNKREE
jgi:hypothetical protein